MSGIGKNAIELKIGSKFGMWTVMTYAGTDEWRNRMYWCKCECGNVMSVRSIALRSGRSTKCRRGHPRVRAR